MKNSELSLMLAGFFLCAAVLPAFARERSKEEKKLETCAGELDKNHSEGQRRVADKIKARFGVDDGRVLGLRLKNMGYGEIAIALGLAQDLPGGITDENLYKIITQRQGPPAAGWGKIAKDLGLKFGPVISKIENISSEVRRQEKADKAEKAKKAEGEKDKEGGKTAKLEKPEKSEKMERPEETEKTSP